MQICLKDEAQCKYIAFTDLKCYRKKRPAAHQFVNAVQRCASVYVGHCPIGPLYSPYNLYINLIYCLQTHSFPFARAQEEIVCLFVGLSHIPFCIVLCVHYVRSHSYPYQRCLKSGGSADKSITRHNIGEFIHSCNMFGRCAHTRTQMYTPFALETLALRSGNKIHPRSELQKPHTLAQHGCDVYIGESLLHSDTPPK